MLINCPSCYTKYDIPTEAIGAEGRNVRCKNCGHSWHQESLEHVDAALLDDLRQLVPDYDKQEAEAGAMTQESSPDITVPMGIMPGREEAVPDFKTLLKNSSYKEKAEKEKIQKRARWGGVAVAAVIFAVFLTVFFSSRVALVKQFRPMLPIYELAGFAIDEPGEGLAFDRLHAVVESKEGKKNVVVKGVIINLTKTEKSIPLLQAKLLDAENKSVGRFVFSPPTEKLAAEDILEFEGKSELENDSGQSLSLTFIASLNK